MINLEKPAPPSDDRRWKIVDRTMRRHGYDPHSLIQTLHTVQETFGYIDEDAMRYVAAALRAPLSLVYGVATFYHFFTLKPQGEHTCVVCTGTACYIKGSQELLNAVDETIGAKPGETCADGKVSVLTARCIGSCGLAPIAILDGEMAGKISPEEIKEKMKEWTAEGVEGAPTCIPTAPPEGPGPQFPDVEGLTKGETEEVTGE